MPYLYPTLEEALDLHSRLIRRFGGAPGVRDLGLLDSALARPRTGYYASLSEEAAALMQSVANNHAFLDGNKRMAFALTAVFLRVNGFRIVVAPDPAERFLIDRVIAGRCPLEEITSWLEARMVAV